MLPQNFCVGVEMNKKSGSKPDGRLIKRLLEELCIDIFAHGRNDRHITLSGNGTNPSEAGNVAYAIMDIIHGDGRRWKKDNDGRIQARAAELKKEYGDEVEDDYYS